mgnify:FL=1
MIRRVLFPVLLLLLGCNAKKQVGNPNLEANENIAIEITHISDSKIQFNIVNETKNAVLLHNHYKLNIEKDVDGVWEKLRILNCPCGAPCAKPAEFIQIESGNNYFYEWNAEESWCGSVNNMGVPDTITEKVKPGKYRIVIIYSTDQKNKRVIYKEFKI